MSSYREKKKTFDSHMIKIYPFYTTLPVFKPMSAALIKRHLCLGTLVSIQKDCKQCLTEEWRSCQKIDVS